MNEQNEQDDRDLREFLKRGLAPMDSEPRRDLWPHVLRRLDERSARVPWLDWALLGTLALWLLLNPRAIPMLLYHL
jgi:hypothetical protein